MRHLSSLLSQAFVALLWLGQAVSLLYMLYRTTLGALSLRELRPRPTGAGGNVFLIVIPCHNEEDSIADTVASILGLDYSPAGLLIYVIADDCSDDTVGRAREAGAHVLAKETPAAGKGAAIHWLLAQDEVQRAGWDALIVFDADSRPNVNFLQIMDGALEGGLRVMQGRRESHVQVGWVPTAYAVNTIHRNRIWHQAREAMGFNAALTGSGYCLSRKLLQNYPVTMRTLTEDLEYTAQLTKAGVRVHYLHAAVVVIDQPPTMTASMGQRLRWARGQLRTALIHTPGLVWRSLTKLDLSALDTALYILIPSLAPMQAFLVVTAGAGLLFSDIGPHAGLPGLPLELIIIVFAGSMVLPYLGLRAERAKFGFRDWVAFLLLMLTWLPIVVVAMLTTSVTTWDRMPHSKVRSSQIAGKPDLEAVPAKDA